MIAVAVFREECGLGVALLGAVAAAFIGFYAAVLVAYIYGTTYAEMRTVEVPDEPAVDERAAA